MNTSMIPVFALLLISSSLCAVDRADCNAESNEIQGSSSVPRCKFTLTESIPVGLTYQPKDPIFNSTFDELTSLVKNAKSRLDIAAFYFSLLGKDVIPNPDESSLEGEKFLETIVEAAKRGVKTRIAVNADDKVSSSDDLNQLKAAGAEIRSVNFTRLLEAGVLHTKFIIADQANFYVGSANMDWRSFTQVKEVGITVRDCSILSTDLLKIFEVYWTLGKSDSIPKKWPEALSTTINAENPANIRLRNTDSQVFLSSSPPQFNPEGRTNDIDAILNVIERAEKCINIAVMDYIPAFLYSNNKAFWPVIDNALRKAAIDRGVQVKLLASKWNYTRKVLKPFLQSLNAIKNMYSKGSIEARIFTVPSNSQQAKIPFARVNHNKYMVTDKDALIGTSNWSADYFVTTAGVSFVSRETNNTCYSDHSLREELTSLFERDWLSDYTEGV